MLEPPIAQVVRVEPIFPQQRFGRGGVCGSALRISNQQISHERQVVRKALVSVQIHLPVEHGRQRLPARDLTNIGLQFGTGENLHYILSELVELRRSFLAQIPAS